MENQFRKSVKPKAVSWKRSIKSITFNQTDQVKKSVDRNYQYQE